MSRIGKEPVKIVDGVTATVDGQKVTVKGKLGELSYTMHDGITAKVEDGAIKVACADDKLLGNFHSCQSSDAVCSGKIAAHNAAQTQNW